MSPVTVKLSMNIPKIIVHALFAQILNEIFYLLSFATFRFYETLLFLEMLRIDM